MIYRAKKLRRYWMDIGARLYYLPSKCPELASVELYFSQLKSKLIKLTEGSEVNLKVNIFVDWVANCIHSVLRDLILKL